jgi:replicative superfamily II helicase
MDIDQELTKLLERTYNGELNAKDIKNHSEELKQEYKVYYAKMIKLNPEMREKDIYREFMFYKEACKDLMISKIIHFLTNVVETIEAVAVVGYTKSS